MGTSFNIGFQGANQAALQKRAQDQAQTDAQRAQTTALYWNAVQTPLPPPTTKDAQGNPITNPAYTDAMTKREGAIKDYLQYLGPEQHATIGDRLHGLIFGPEQQEMQQSAQQAQTAQAANAPPPAAAPAAAPTHPFSSNPAYAKIQEGLTGLGNRLKAFAHPLPAQPAPDYATLAAAPSEEERRNTQADLLEQEREEAALERAKITAGSKPINKYTFGLNKYAESLGKDVDDLSDADVSAFNKQFSAEGRAPQKPTIEKDPTTGQFLALSTGPDGNIIAKPVTDVNGQPVGGFKPETVSRRSGFYYYTDNKGVLHQVPTTTETDTIFGPTADQNAKTAPKSSQAPQVPLYISESFQGKTVPGMTTQGNIDLTKRPNIQNPDGTHSSVYSMSFSTDNGEVLVPGVGDGTTYPLRKLTQQEALDQYRKTGKNLGTFKTAKDADAYAGKLHEDQAKYGNNPLAATNQRIQNANSTSKKLTKKAPASTQAPNPDQVINLGRPIGQKESPLDKADTAQYTKVAEDANTKQEAYDSARKALAAGSTPSSDQELIYSWVRSNVQGAGRMTQAEFRQAASIGSLPLRAQTAWQKTLTGKLPPEMEQMLLADVKRASDTANQEAQDLRGRIGGGAPISNQAPQAPSGTPKVRVYNPATGTLQ